MPGPTRGSANRNDAIGTTVQTRASAAIETQPDGASAAVVIDDVDAPNVTVPIAAPVTTSVASSRPSTRAVKRSASRT